MANPALERRSSPRSSLQLPVGLQAHAGDGTPWRQWALTRDVSAGGVSLEPGPDVARGQVLYLELPLPSGLRQFDIDAPVYGVYGVVRDVVEGARGPRVSVQFLGRTPPQGHDRHPGALYLRSDDVAAPNPSESAQRDPWERRLSTRLRILVNVVLRALEPTGQVEREELTVTEDVSQGGLRVKTTLDAQPGDVLVVEHPESGFLSRVGVCDSWVADDGVRRLNLTFLDGKTAESFIGK